MSTCGAVPDGKGWPVCTLPKDHDGQHETANFTWAEGASAVSLRPAP